MKRSELVTKIEEYLLYTEHLDIPCSLGSDFKAAAEELVVLIEKTGMLPPLHIFEDQHESYCATYDNDECTCNPFRDNIWEPENEEK